MALSPLYASLFPSAPPVELRGLPACTRRLKVFVYDSLVINATKASSAIDLQSRAKTTAEVLQAMDERRGRANCDWARQDCVERTHSGSGGSWDYSNQRQYAAEVPLLAKFLLLAASQPAPSVGEADLYVVPWLGSTELSWYRRQWSPSSALVNSRFRSVLQQLTHYAGRERRHVFLSSRDLAFCALEVKREALLRGAMLLHYGPKRPHASGDIVVAPNSAGFGAPLTPLPHPPKHLLFSMMDPKLNPQRSAFGEALRILNASRSDVRYYPIVDHRSISLPPSVAFEMMRHSLLCPIAQGDLPYQHRLFDALVAGCVPLLLSYRAHVDRRPCEAWSWDPRTGGSGRLETIDGVAQRPRAANCIEQEPSWLSAWHVCREQTLPYHRTVPWRDISVRLDASLLERPAALAQAIEALDRSDLKAKRRRLEGVRARFVYDWSGGSSDAFASTLEEICAALPPSDS